MPRSDDSNFSVDGRKPRERRFDVDDPGPIKPNPFDVARDAYWAMDQARAAVLGFWAAHALTDSPTRVGWSSADADSGGSYVSDLLELVGPDATFTPTVDEFKGALLTYGHFPTRSTRDDHDWRVKAEYRGIPGSGPIRAQFDNLVAEIL